jgi:hypothetical protein
MLRLLGYGLKPFSISGAFYLASHHTAFADKHAQRFACVYWGVPFYIYSSTRSAPATLAKARAHFCTNVTFVGATPFSIIT